MQVRRPGHRTIWGMIAALFTGYELYTIYNEQDGDTWSEMNRAIGRTHTVTGKVATGSFLGGFFLWYWVHILFPERVPALDKRKRT